MNTALEIIVILVATGAAAALVWRAKPQRDVCQPLSNDERLLRYIDRRAAWECEQRKRKLQQRQRVERMLEQRWLNRTGPVGVTVPQPRAQRRAA